MGIACSFCMSWRVNASTHYTSRTGKRERSLKMILCSDRYPLRASIVCLGAYVRQITLPFASVSASAVCVFRLCSDHLPLSACFVRLGAYCKLISILFTLL